MGMHEYLKSLSDLEMINRAPGYFKFEEHNVGRLGHLKGVGGHVMFFKFKVARCPVDHFQNITWPPTPLR